MHTPWTSWTFLWIILWVFIWPVFLLLMRKMRGKSSNYSGNKTTPLDTLKERYAKGEINKSEFEEKKKDIL